MKFPENTKAYLQGAAVGAIVLAIVGFSWGGWVTGSTATKNAGVAAHEAVVAVLAPICVDRYRGQADAVTKVAALSTASSWDRGNMVEKSGFATMPGAKTADTDVARACADILTKPETPKT